MCLFTQSSLCPLCGLLSSGCTQAGPLSGGQRQPSTYLPSWSLSTWEPRGSKYRTRVPRPTAYKSWDRIQGIPALNPGSRAFWVKCKELGVTARQSWTKSCLGTKEILPSSSPLSSLSLTKNTPHPCGSEAEDVRMREQDTHGQGTPPPL